MSVAIAAPPAGITEASLCSVPYPHYRAKGTLQPLPRGSRQHQSVERQFEAETRVAPRSQRTYVCRMRQSDRFRENAENCLQLAEQAADEPKLKRYRRMASAWYALAREQQWLDGEIHPNENVAVRKDAR